MGQLSHVRHVAPGETVILAGESVSVLYVVNRGVLEVMPDPGAAPAAAVYLSRGDVAGAVEALTGTNATFSVCAREAASLQCVEAKNFDELTRRVPSFFRFIAERLATRAARYPAAPPQHALELSGTFLNFDLITIFQTITSTTRTGELLLADPEKKAIGAFFFDHGRLRAGWFQHLLGDEAFSQLFLADITSASFSFSSENKAPAYLINGVVRSHNDASLINALRARDEFESLLHQMSDSSAVLRCHDAVFELSPTIDPTIQHVARSIWDVAGREPTRLRDLYALCFVCELKVYQAVQELVSADLVTLQADQVNNPAPLTRSAAA